MIDHGQVSIFDAEGRPANREIKITSASAALVDKAGHSHFMAKEIHEQPEVIGHTLAHYLDPAGPVVRRQGKRPARGAHQGDTADHFGLRHRLLCRYGRANTGSRNQRLAVETDVASELRYRNPVYPKDGAALFVSQSGETADTLAALRDARDKGQITIAVVNVAESSIAREADIVLPTFAGPEIGVASTKALPTQPAALASFAIAAGVARGNLREIDEQRLCASLLEAPRHIAGIPSSRKTRCARWARKSPRPVTFFIWGGARVYLAGAGRCAQAQGNFLHPCRRLRRRRNETRSHRLDRRGSADHRHRPP